MIYKDIVDKIRTDYYIVKKEMYKQLYKYNGFRKYWMRLEKDVKIHSSVLKFFGNCEFSGRENKFLSMWNVFMYMKCRHPDEKDEDNIEMLAKTIFNNRKFWLKYVKEVIDKND